MASSQLDSHINAQCAALRQGYMVPLAKHHPIATHLYIDHSWTEEEVIKFEAFKHPPVIPFVLNFNKDTCSLLCRIARDVPVSGPPKPGTTSQTYVYAPDMYFPDDRPIFFIIDCSRGSADTPSPKVLMFRSENLHRPAVERSIRDHKQTAANAYTDLATLLSTTIKRDVFRADANIAADLQQFRAAKVCKVVEAMDIPWAELREDQKWVPCEKYLTPAAEIFQYQADRDMGVRFHDVLPGSRFCPRPTGPPAE